MRQNELFIFDKFKLNTDAAATNRGFLYQYLKTLKEWLSIAINQPENVIYCEVEDDIKEINTELQTVKFTQIKCYSRNLGTNDEEIEKSLYNFFMLSNIYREYKGTYLFETNTNIKRNDNLLREWSENQESINPELLQKCVEKVREVLESLIDQKKSSSMKKIDKQIDELDKQDKDIAEKLSVLNDQKKDIQEEFDILFKKVQDNVYMENFISKIKWKFDIIEGETAVELLKTECLALLKQYTISPSFLLLTRLLSEIYIRSSNAKVEERKLDKKLLDVIIEESFEEMLSKTNQDITSFLQEINGRLDVMQEFMGREFTDIKDLIVSKTIDSVKSVLPYYTKDHIETFLSEEDNKIQSKLERKIKNMNLDEDDEDDLITIATTFRCRYLLHLEQLQLEGLDVEFNQLKALEETVRQECFEAKLMIEEEENFNSFRFWTEFKKKLEIIAKSKQIQDFSIVHAQMYQMAAECPLRWNKVRT